MVHGPSGYADLQNTDGRSAEWRKSPLPGGGTVVLISDATERKQIDERLRQIQRIEALGKISGEVAHDFGNIMSTISGSLHLMDTAGPERHASLRQTMGSAVDLGMSLTQRLLTFAKRQQLDPETVELNCLVDGLSDLIGFALNDDITLEIHTIETPLPVRVDPGQMESAILNLCMNAGQAIEGQGHIILSVMQNHGQAVIEVTDTGPGMIPEVLAHAMEPFFTARKDGHGTGLGLAMVYGFMRQSGGDVLITSAVGQGTTIRLTLPIQADTPPPETLRKFGTVLLIEDNPADLAQAKTVIAPWATHMIACTDATEAQIHLANESVDLILTDLTLDGKIEGWQLAATALTLAPQRRAIILSGHLPSNNPLSAVFYTRVQTLAKPLTTAKLAAVLASFQT